MQEQGGFVKLYRKLLDWEWYDDANTKLVFLHVLLKANWKDAKYHGEVIRAGEYRTTLPELADELHLSIKNVRTALEHLKAAGCVAVKNKSKYRIITVKNWGAYQGNGSQNGSQAAGSGQANGRQAADTLSLYKEEEKEVNNEKREKKGAAEPAPPSLSEIAQYISAMGYDFSAEKFFNYYEGQGWKRRGQAIVNWKAVADNWQATEQKDKPTAQTKGEPDSRTSLDYDDLSRFGLYTD